MKDYLLNCWESVKNFFITNAHAVIVFAAVLIFGFILVKIISKIFDRSMNRSRLKGAAGDFLTDLVKVILYIVYVIALLALLGVPTTSMIALLSAFALAISLALQGTFSNVAAGIVIVLTKPFEEGDYVDIGGAAGSVETITIFNTKLVTPDNKVVILPNSTVSASNITNYSTKDIRRVDLDICTTYGADIEKVKATVLAVVGKHGEILTDPAPFIRMTEYGESSVKFTSRVWVKQADFWNVKFDLTEELVTAFAAEGIVIPFPQVDVHMH